MEAVELRQLSNTIAGSIGRPLGEFKQAAADSHKNLSRVVKDISGMFAAQKKDTAGISEAIQESIDAGNQHAQKAEQTNNLIQESISIQSSMAAEIKNMVVGIRNLTSAVTFMASSTNNTSIFGKMFDALGALSPLGKLALTAGAAITGGSIIGGMMGRQDVKEGGGSGYEQSGLSRQNVADMIRKSAIQRGMDPETAVAVAKSEGLNTYRSSAPGGKWGMEREPSFGPFQLLMGRGTGGPEGLGDRFKAATGIDPSTDRSPASIQKQIDYALDEAKTKGWGQWYGAARAGIGNRQGLNVDTSGMKIPEISIKTEAAKEQVTPKSTVTSTAGGGTLGFGLQGAMSSDQKTNIGAAAPAGKLASLTPTGGAGSYPSGDIIGLGKALQGEGLRVSEHPSFGGVLGKHHGRGHYEGRAIDINMGYGVTESKSAALGARFDALADKLTSLGYKVFWRGKGQGKYGLAGHENHLHAEVPAGGAQVAAGQTTGTATDTETPQAAVAQETATAAPQLSPFGQQLQQAAGIISGGMEEGFPMMSGGALGGMGALGGLMGGMDFGSIISSLIPSLTSAAPNITPSIAQMIPDTSNTTRNVAMVNQAQIQSQAEDHNARMALVENSEKNQKQDSQSMTSMAQDGSVNSWDYNNASDLKWPEWADLGRTGWSEVNKIRTIA